jgi:hypothetical protein
MDEVTIYKLQLQVIIDALRLTSNLHNSHKGETSFDRQVRQALQFAKNAIDGNKDTQVKYT